MNSIQTKQKIVQHLYQLLDQKINTAEVAIQSAKEARDHETKSSAGDKFETGRAMMQIEQQKNEVQLSKAITLKKTLEQINLDKVPLENAAATKVELGSLVQTTAGLFFLAIGIGKIEIEKKKIFVISLAAPMGKLLFGKKAGDEINFQGKTSTIITVN